MTERERESARDRNRLENIQKLFQLKFNTKR